MATDTGYDWGGLLTGLAGAGISSNTAGNTATANANAQLEAARIAADAAAFRPIGVTTRFGTSGFQYDDQGRLSGAGYQAAPDVAAQREAMMGLSGGALNQAQMAQNLAPGYFQGAGMMSNLGQQYLSADPAAAQAKYMAQQQGLVAPGREQMLSGIRNKLFQTGRSGLATGATNAGGMGATNPEMQAYYNTMAQQDAQFAANANTQSQADTRYGVGLMGSAQDYLQGGFNTQQSAFAPWKAGNAGVSLVEGQAQDAMKLGTGLGSSMAAAGAAQGNALLQGGQAAAEQLAEGAKTQNRILSGFIDQASPGIASGLNAYFRS